MTSLVIKHHNAGFFSCSSLRLHDIIYYFNTHQQLPDIVDSSIQYNWYKLENDNKDITFDYFDHYDHYTNIEYVKNIDFHYDFQFHEYSKINYMDLSPFMEKYFSPSMEVQQRMVDLEKKYDINYDNICVLFYRGNDKITETKLCDYTDYVIYAKEVFHKNPNIRFLIQSDETEFIETMTSIFPENSFYMREEIRHIPKCKNTVDRLMRDNIHVFSKLFLAITIIMSKCKYIICGTGNCSIWIMLYRGNADNVYQFCIDKWLF